MVEEKVGGDQVELAVAVSRNPFEHVCGGKLGPPAKSCKLGKARSGDQIGAVEQCQFDRRPAPCQFSRQDQHECTVTGSDFQNAARRLHDMATKQPVS